MQRVSYQRIHQSDEKSEQNEVFSEDDNILSGEPKWFVPSSQDILSDSSVDVFDKGAIRRTLPLYLLYDENCFPTGTKCADCKCNKVHQWQQMSSNKS